MAELREITSVELKEILEQHQKWVKSTGKEGKQANLHKVNLRGADLAQACLEKADLRQADLQEAALQGANLSGAQVMSTNLRDAMLLEARLHETILIKANLQNCNLKKAHCAHADFLDANLQGAYLRESYFREANLLRAKFRDADLQDADLTKAKGLLGGQLSGANVSGANLPEDIAKFEGLSHVEETSRNARKIFFAMLLGCVYSWLTIATTTDVRLITNSASSPLPIIQTQIPIAGFYWAAPVILIALYIYFHLYLQRFWEGLSDLPAVFPDGRSLDKRAYPWLLTGLVCAHFNLLRAKRPPLSRLQNGVSILLAWWSVPVTLLFFWLRFLPMHEWWGTSLHIGLMATSVGFWITTQRLARRTLRGEERKRYVWREALKDERTYKRVALTIGTLGVLVIFYLLSLGAIEGVSPYLYLRMAPLKVTIDEQTGKKSYSLDKSKLPEEKLTDVRTWVPLYLWYFGFSTFAELSEEDVSVKPTPWNEKGGSIQYSLVKGAQLRRRNLRNANARRAFLANADLRWANLKDAILVEADLSGANLYQADLQGATLDLANFQRAILKEAILLGVDLSKIVGLTQEQVNEACMNEKTKLPDGLIKPAKQSDLCMFLQTGRIE